MTDSIDEFGCSKCSFYDKLDRDYLDYIKKDVKRTSGNASDSDKSLPFLGLEISEDDFDEEINDLWKTNHSYHLSWAVFKHLSCK